MTSVGSRPGFFPTSRECGLLLRVRTTNILFRSFGPIALSGGYIGALKPLADTFQQTSPEHTLAVVIVDVTACDKASG